MNSSFGHAKYRSSTLFFLFGICLLAVADHASAESPPAAERAGGYSRAIQSYSVPDVTLRDIENERVNLQQLLEAEHKSILVQFIFTSCQTICPMLTAIMAQAQDDLRRVAPGTRIVSISIDPQHDTPDRLRRYAERFGAEGDWRFLTGDWKSIRRTLNAFDAMYEGGSKMYHRPYTFMRKSPDHPWVRLIGTMAADQLVGEYTNMLAREPELPTPARTAAGIP